MTWTQRAGAWELRSPTVRAASVGRRGCVRAPLPLAWRLPCDVTWKCAPARRLRTSVRHRESCIQPHPIPSRPPSPFHNLVTCFPRNWGTQNLSPVPLRVFSPLPGSSYHLQGKPCLDAPAPLLFPALLSPPVGISHPFPILKISQFIP